MCVCLCASFALHWRCRTALFLCLTFLINILLLLSSFSLSPSLLLGHENKVLSMLHHTPLKDWLTGWNPVRTIWVASGTIKKKTATTRWLQTILLLFVFNLYLLKVVWQSPAHGYTLFSYSHRSCPMQPIFLTRGHLADSSEQWWSRAGQLMIAVKYSFVQSTHQECQIIFPLLSQFLLPHQH